MADRITILSTDRSIVEPDGTMTLQTRAFFRSLYVQALIIGTGSPEGVVEARQFSQYIDEDAGTGAIEYRKMQPSVGGDTKKGWVLV